MINSNNNNEYIKISKHVRRAILDIYEKNLHSIHNTAIDFNISMTTIIKIIDNPNSLFRPSLIKDIERKLKIIKKEQENE